MMKKRIALTLLVALSLPACLKTRAQLREGDEVPAPQAQEVGPQDSYAIDEIKNELTHLNGRVGDLERAQQAQQGEEAKAKDEKIIELEKKITELEQKQAAMQEALEQMKAMPKLDKKSMFLLGKQNYQAKNYKEAAALFTQYLDSGDNDHQQEATFLRAETYFSMKEYKKAILDYSKFPQSYPKSKRVPVALLRIGDSFQALGLAEDAKPFYQELISKFPKSGEAKTARKKLDGNKHAKKRPSASPSKKKLT